MRSRMILEGKWEEAKGRIKEAWGVLTDDDLDKSEGNWQQLVAVIKQKTGESLETVETKLNKALDSLSEMVEDDGETQASDSRTEQGSTVGSIR
jgi:uncharacterized protein YjbJ (UPF0337 family)